MVENKLVDSMAKRAKRIVYGLDKRTVRARKLYESIESGAREQRRIQHLYERMFFSPGFEEKRLVEEATRFNGSRRKQIELTEYAKRLARKRKWILKRFKAWGLKPGHMGKPMEKTPNGVSARKILSNLTGWNIDEKVKMVPAIDMIAFSVGPEAFKTIIKSELPKTGNAPCFALGGEEGTIDTMISPSLENIRKHGPHERAHVVGWELPLTQELYQDKRQRTDKKTLTQSFAPTNLQLGTKVISRYLLDELIANMLDKRIAYFEKRYKKYYIADYSRDFLGPKTAASFMHNKGNYRTKMLKATKESTKAVRKALTAYVRGPKQEKVKAVSREELASWLRNIRDIEKIPKRLPVLVEMKKRKMRKRIAGKKVNQ